MRLDPGIMSFKVSVELVLVLSSGRQVSCEWQWIQLTHTTLSTVRKFTLLSRRLVSL